MELIKMIRGDDVANVRPEWVEQWEGWGWKPEAESQGEDGKGDETKTARRGRAPKPEAESQGEA